MEHAMWILSSLEKCNTCHWKNFNKCNHHPLSRIILLKHTPSCIFLFIYEQKKREDRIGWCTHSKNAVFSSSMLLAQLLLPLTHAWNGYGSCYLGSSCYLRSTWTPPLLLWNTSIFILFELEIPFSTLCSPHEMQTRQLEIVCIGTGAEPRPHVHHTLPHHADLISTDALSLRLSMVAVT